MGRHPRRCPLHGAAEDARGSIRWRQPDSWGAWHPLSVWEDAGDDDAELVASGLVRPGPGGLPDGAALAGRRQRPRGRGHRRRLRPGPDPAGVDRHHQLAEPPGSSTGRGPCPAGGDHPPRLGRRRGDAQGADRGRAPISKLVVHHTVTPNDDPDPAQTVRAVYAYHTRHNGWNDVGYNFLVDQQGRVYEGRFARPYRPG